MPPCYFPSQDRWRIGNVPSPTHAAAHANSPTGGGGGGGPGGPRGLGGGVADPVFSSGPLGGSWLAGPAGSPGGGGGVERSAPTGLARMSSVRFSPTATSPIALGRPQALQSLLSQSSNAYTAQHQLPAAVPPGLGLGSNTHLSVGASSPKQYTQYTYGSGGTQCMTPLAAQIERQRLHALPSMPHSSAAGTAAASTGGDANGSAGGSAGLGSLTSSASMAPRHLSSVNSSVGDVGLSVVIPSPSGVAPSGLRT